MKPVVNCTPSTLTKKASVLLTLYLCAYLNGCGEFTLNNPNSVSRFATELTVSDTTTAQLDTSSINTSNVSGNQSKAVPTISDVVEVATFAASQTEGIEKALKASPGSIELEDWTSGSAVIVGRTQLDNALDDINWDDADLSSAMGIVKVKGVSQPIRWKGFEFGALHLFSPIAAINNKPLDQVLIGAKPFGRWSTYPYADTFNPATDVTTPPAFKVKLYATTGELLYTYQMRDQKPINDPSLSQTRKIGTGALRPLFNVGMLLPWQSSQTKVNPKAKQLMPGFKDDYPETKSKLPYATNGSSPLLADGADGRNQVNGLNHWHLLPKWPLAADAASDINQDPFSFDPLQYWTGSDRYKTSAWVSGWDYEPGSISGHDWFTGPGGMRFDRAVLPTPLAYFASNPNWVRSKEKNPIRDMVDAWGMAYFNHSGHYVTDVTNFSQILSTAGERATNSQMGAYYLPKINVAPLSKSIDMRGISNGDYALNGANGGTDPAYYLDSKGNRFWGGWLVDEQHAYQVPYWHSIAFSSPMHLLASRAAFNQSHLARLGAKNITMRPTNSWTPGPSYASVNSRVQAYRWLHYALMWKMGTTSNFGFRQKDIERMLIDDLNHWHDTILVPLKAETRNPYHVAIQRLGVPAQAVQMADGWYLVTDGTALNYYHAGLFMTLKSLGLWERLRQDEKSRNVLDFVAQSLTKYSSDFILETNGLAESANGTVPLAGPFNRFEDITANDVPTWTQWAKRFPRNGAETWTRNEKGVLAERYPGQYLRAQWSILMRDWFPEYSNSNVELAAQKYEAFLAEWTTFVNSKTTASEKVRADTQFMILPYSPYKKP
jgi:hypothetical protein